jgi:hypothetical protein
MLVVRIGGNVGVVRSVVVTEDAPSLTNIGVGIVYTYRISQFSAYRLVKVKI